MLCLTQTLSDSGSDRIWETLMGHNLLTWLTRPINQLNNLLYVSMCKVCISEHAINDYYVALYVCSSTDVQYCHDVWLSMLCALFYRGVSEEDTWSEVIQQQKLFELFVKHELSKYRVSWSMQVLSEEEMLSYSGPSPHARKANCESQLGNWDGVPQGFRC